MNDNLLQLKQAFADEGYDDDDDDDNTNTNDEPKTTIMASAHTRDDCSDLTDANNDHAEEQPNKSFPQRVSKDIRLCVRLYGWCGVHDCSS